MKKILNQTGDKAIGRKVVSRPGLTHENLGRYLYDDFTYYNNFGYRVLERDENCITIFDWATNKPLLKFEISNCYEAKVIELHKCFYSILEHGDKVDYYNHPVEDNPNDYKGVPVVFYLYNSEDEVFDTHTGAQEAVHVFIKMVCDGSSECLRSLTIRLPFDSRGIINYEETFDGSSHVCREIGVFKDALDRSQYLHQIYKVNFHDKGGSNKIRFIHDIDFGHPIYEDSGCQEVTENDLVDYIQDEDIGYQRIIEEYDIDGDLIG
jgi:hypothetical protein